MDWTTEDDDRGRDNGRDEDWTTALLEVLSPRGFFSQTNYSAANPKNKAIFGEDGAADVDSFDSDDHLGVPESFRHIVGNMRRNNNKNTSKNTSRNTIRSSHRKSDRRRGEQGEQGEQGRRSTRERMNDRVRTIDAQSTDDGGSSCSHHHKYHSHHDGNHNNIASDTSNDNPSSILTPRLSASVSHLSPRGLPSPRVLMSPFDRPPEDAAPVVLPWRVKREERRRREEERERRAREARQLSEEVTLSRRVSAKEALDAERKRREERKRKGINVRDLGGDDQNSGGGDGREDEGFFFGQSFLGWLSPRGNTGNDGDEGRTSKKHDGRRQKYRNLDRRNAEEKYPGENNFSRGGGGGDRDTDTDFENDVSSKNSGVNNDMRVSRSGHDMCSDDNIENNSNNIDDNNDNSTNNNNNNNADSGLENGLNGDGDNEADGQWLDSKPVGIRNSVNHGYVRRRKKKSVPRPKRKRRFEWDAWSASSIMTSEYDDAMGDLSSDGRRKSSQFATDDEQSRGGDGRGGEDDIDNSSWNMDEGTDINSPRWGGGGRGGGYLSDQSDPKSPRSHHRTEGDERRSASDLVNTISVSRLPIIGRELLSSPDKLAARDSIRLKEEEEEARARHEHAKNEEISHELRKLTTMEQQTHIVAFDQSVLRRQYLLLFTATMGIFLMMSHLWLVWFPDVRELRSSTESRMIKVLETITTCVLLCQIAEYYRHQLRAEAHTWHIHDSTVWRKYYKFFFVIEVLVLGWHQYPEPGGIDFYDDRLGVLMFLRLYLILRVMRNMSTMYRNRLIISKDETIRNFVKVNYNWHFATKMYFTEHLNFCVLLIMSISFCVLSYALWIFERSERDPAVPPLDFTLYDALWVTLQAITTLGFGDIPITSSRGKIVCGLAAVAGICESALLVMAVGELLFMNAQALLLMHTEIRMEQEPTQREDAAIYIQRVWRHYLSIRGHEKDSALRKWVAKEWRTENEILKQKCKHHRMILRNATPKEEIVVERFNERLQELAPLFAAAVAFQLGGKIGERKVIPTIGDLADQLDRLHDNHLQMFSGLNYIEDIINDKLSAKDLEGIDESYEY